MKKVHPERTALEYLAFPLIGALPSPVSTKMVGREKAITASRVNFVLELAVSAAAMVAYTNLSNDSNMGDVSPFLVYAGVTLMRLDQLVGNTNYQPESHFNAHPIGSPPGTFLYGAFDFFRKAKNIVTYLI